MKHEPEAAYRRRIGQHIRQHLEETGISENALSVRAGLSNKTVTSLINSSYSPSLKTLCKLGPAIDVPVWRMLAPKGEL